MFFQTDSWASAFLESEYQFFIEDSLKEKAEALLDFSINELKSFNPHFPENVTQAQFKALFIERFAKLDLPLDIKKQAPQLLTSFVQFLSLSGLYPPASDWEGMIESAQTQFEARFRKDGSFKGETLRRFSEKISRNAPCPCNSGKKYKQCCGK